MSIYSVTRNGRKYTYEYDRSKYDNNSETYNKMYYTANKERLVKKSKARRLDERIDRLGDLVNVSTEETSKG